MSELQKAKLEVMKAVPYVQKSKAPGLSYKALMEAELISKLHDAMIANGLTMEPCGIEFEARDSYSTSKGAVMQRAVIKARYRLSHVGGEYVELMVAGEGADVGDKATSKAMTCAYKYAIRQAFFIETGDDPDYHPSEEQEQARQQPVAPTITPEQEQALRNALAAAGLTGGQFCAAAKLDKLADLKQSRLRGARDWIVKNAKAKEPESEEEVEHAI